MENNNNNNSKKMEINSILSIGNDLIKSNSNNHKQGIYKNELFNGMNDREKRSLRIKFRNKLSYFVDTMFEYSKTNNLEKCRALGNSLNQYAENVYNNINVLYENNTTFQKASKIDEFRKLVETYSNTVTQSKIERIIKHANQQANKSVYFCR